MKLNEKLAAILAIAEDDRRQESIARAEKQKPKLIDKLVSQAQRGSADGILLDDDDRVYLDHLSSYFAQEGFEVKEPEHNRILITVSR
jgi:PleD family two-component response regulator